MKELVNWASIFFAFGVALETPMSQELWMHLKEVTMTIMEFLDPTFKNSFTVEALAAAKGLVVYMDTHRSGEEKKA